MNIKEIRQLIKLMVDNDLSELDIASGEEKVSLKRGPGGVPIVMTAPAAMQAAAAPAEPEAEATPSEPADDLIEIKSPMVGTFYASASPDSDQFVQVGDAIGPETVICIIEAMKVMNEIKAECAGVIVEVCVSNTQPVEFGQVLLRVKPN